MLKQLRYSLPLTALAAVLASGCLLTTGQVVLTYDFAAHGYDPIEVSNPNAVAGINVDLKSYSAYNEHKKELKDIEDLAVVGTVMNLDTTAPVDIEVWLVAHNAAGGFPVLATDAQVRAAGMRVWGPLHLAPGETRDITWNESSALFTNKAFVMAQAKGDGRFGLYTLGSNGYHYRVSHASIIAVVAGGK
jgi:hypothetical protein